MATKKTKKKDLVHLNHFKKLRTRGFFYGLDAMSRDNIIFFVALPILLYLIIRNFAPKDPIIGNLTFSYVGYTFIFVGWFVWLAVSAWPRRNKYKKNGKKDEVVSPTIIGGEEIGVYGSMFSGFTTDLDSSYFIYPRGVGRVNTRTSYEFGDDIPGTIEQIRKGDVQPNIVHLKPLDDPEEDEGKEYYPNEDLWRLFTGPTVVETVLAYRLIHIPGLVWKHLRAYKDNAEVIEKFSKYGQGTFEELIQVHSYSYIINNRRYLERVLTAKMEMYIGENGLRSKYAEELKALDADDADIDDNPKLGEYRQFLNDTGLNDYIKKLHPDKLGKKWKKWFEDWLDKRWWVNLLELRIVDLRSPKIEEAMERWNRSLGTKLKRINLAEALKEEERLKRLGIFQGEGEGIDTLAKKFGYTGSGKDMNEARKLVWEYHLLRKMLQKNSKFIDLPQSVSGLFKKFSKP